MHLSVPKSPGEAIKAVRIYLRRSQDDVAEALGASRQTVSLWERGTNEPRVTYLKKLWEMGINRDYLLCMSSNPLALPMEVVQINIDAAIKSETPTA